MKRQGNTSPEIVGGLTRKVGLVVTVAIGVAAIASLVITLAVFGDGLRAQLSAKAVAAGDVLRRDIVAALDFGVPFAQLRGLDALAAQTAADRPEIADVTILRVQTTTAATPPAASGLNAISGGLLPALVPDRVSQEIKQPLIWRDQTIGTVIITLDPGHLANQMRNVFFDTLIILIATTLVAFELVTFLTRRSLLGPLQLARTALSARADGQFGLFPIGRSIDAVTQLIKAVNQANNSLLRRAQRHLGQPRVADYVQNHGLQMTGRPSVASVIDARIPLFLFCFAEELQKSFLPLFVAEMHQPSDLFSVDIMMGLPISAFMLVIAVLTPFAGMLVDRYGNRTLFLAGLCPAIAGYIICAVAASGNDILLGRAITAIGYAIITISCQSYIAKVVAVENRARGMAVFVGVLMTATLCGTAIGAILADWLSYKPVFVIAAGLAGVAGIAGYLMLDPDPESTKTAGKGTAQGSGWPLLRSRQFLSLLLFCAIPTKIVLTGVLYLFVPVYLASLEVTQSEIGRIMMVYSLVIIPISPLAAGFADRIGGNLKVAAVASLASGVVLLGLLADPTIMAVLIIVIGLGIAHAFLKAPLIVSVMEVAETLPDVPMTAALGLLRTCERIGSFVGPVLVAVLMVYFSDVVVAAIVGLGVSVFALMLLAIMRTAKAPPLHT